MLALDHSGFPFHADISHQAKQANPKFSLHSVEAVPGGMLPPGSLVEDEAGGAGSELAFILAAFPLL